MTSTKNIVIVGAGVIGLTTALKLSESSEKEEDYKITIVAGHFPSDGLSPEYTSNWAGAHYRPFPSHTEKDFQDSQLTRLTQEYFRELARTEPESSIRFIQGIDYVEDKGIYDIKSKGYFEDIKGLEEIPQDSLPKGVQFGAKYDTWVLNSPLYLQYLERKLKFKYGVQFVKSKLISLKQVSLTFPYSLIINCTGLGLGYNGGYDIKSFPIRGQTLLLRVPSDCPYLEKTITHQGKDGLWTFVIPRPLNGGLILGGTKQLNDLQTTPRDSDTQSLIERARKLYPEIFFKDGNIDIQGVNVGFRPAREGGIRIEKESVENGKKIIHAYGAGGMGFELSYGVACKVHELVRSLELKSKL